MKASVFFLSAILVVITLSTKAQTSSFNKIKIVSVKNLEEKRPNAQEVYIGDLIQFQIEKSDSIELREPQDLYLYINGYRLSPYQAKYITDKSIVFQLFESDTLRGLLNRDINSWGIHETRVRMSFGNASGEHVHIDSANMTIDFDPNFAIRSWIGRGIIVLIIIVFFILVKQNSFLKALASSKYSLSRVQMAWWTMIVICCYIALWSDSGILVPLTTDTLILLGISAGTAATAQTIDIARIKGQQLVDKKPNEAIYKDQSFLFQILQNIF